MTMECVFCKKGPPHVDLYRLNATGQKGIWACSEHVNQTDIRPKDDVLDIVSALGGKTPKSQRRRGKP